MTWRQGKWTNEKVKRKKGFDDNLLEHEAFNEVYKNVQKIHITRKNIFLGVWLEVKEEREKFLERKKNCTPRKGGRKSSKTVQVAKICSDFWTRNIEWIFRSHALKLFLPPFLLRSHFEFSLPPLQTFFAFDPQMLPQNSYFQNGVFSRIGKRFKLRWIEWL